MEETMTTTQQPEALRLADLLDADKPTILRVHAEEAGEELRRLHARVVELEQGLQYANSAFTGLQKRKDDWKWRALEAESQLEAIGAGGVESLRGAKPLTDKQIMELFEKHYSHDQPQGQYFVEIVRHAERAHNIGI